jgi:hypothetical protein
MDVLAIGSFLVVKPGKREEEALETTVSRKSRD